MLWDLTRQLGVSQVVAKVPEGPNDPPAWDFDQLRDGPRNDLKPKDSI